MRRKLFAFVACLAFSAPAWAQADQSNPFMEMARRFKEGHDFWQDEKFQHAYDAYFDCYEKYVSGSSPKAASRSATDAAFHGAYTSCEASRIAGIKAAEARIADFHPDMSAEDRADRAATYRRTLAVLRLGASFKKIGLADAYNDYFGRTTEF